MKFSRAMSLGILTMLALWTVPPAHAITGIDSGMSLRILAVPAAPEPASLGLLAAGSAALLLRRHRR